jgi:hypothetical protein
VLVMYAMLCNVGNVHSVLVMSLSVNRNKQCRCPHLRQLSPKRLFKGPNNFSQRLSSVRMPLLLFLNLRWVIQIGPCSGAARVLGSRGSHGEDPLILVKSPHVFGHGTRRVVNRC